MNGFSNSGQIVIQNWGHFSLACFGIGKVWCNFAKISRRIRSCYSQLAQCRPSCGIRYQRTQEVQVNTGNPGEHAIPSGLRARGLSIVPSIADQFPKHDFTLHAAVPGTCHSAFSSRDTPSINFHFFRVWPIWLLTIRTDMGTFPVSRETEPCEGARGRSSLLVLIQRFYADLNRPLARLLASAEILAQKRQNHLLSWFSGLQSRYVANWLHTDLKTRSLSRNIINWLASHIDLPYAVTGWHGEVYNRAHHSCHSHGQESWLHFRANNRSHLKIDRQIHPFHI
jgi:hypothetical protein